MSASFTGEQTNLEVRTFRGAGPAERITVSPGRLQSKFERSWGAAVRAGVAICQALRSRHTRRAGSDRRCWQARPNGRPGGSCGRFAPECQPAVPQGHLLARQWVQVPLTARQFVTRLLRQERSDAATGHAFRPMHHPGPSLRASTPGQDPGPLRNRRRCPTLPGVTLSPSLSSRRLPVDASEAHRSARGRCRSRRKAHLPANQVATPFRPRHAAEGGAGGRSGRTGSGTRSSLGQGSRHPQW